MLTVYVTAVLTAIVLAVVIVLMVAGRKIENLAKNEMNKYVSWLREEE